MLFYLLKSTVCLLAFSLFYKLFLEKENIHVFKRFYLLGSLALSFYIPLITFTTYIEQPVMDFQVSNSFTPNAIEVIPVEEPTNWIPILLWFLYGLGTLFFAVKFLLNLYRLIEKIRSNEKVQHKDYVHVLLLKHIVPHTFMKYIFLDKQAFDNYNIPQEILLHEQAHAQQKHSLDILFAEFLQILFWFNPLIYSIKKDIKLNHEFLADHEVIKQGYNAKNYQTILLSYSSKPSGYPLESSFNYSSIKKRFTLMKTHTSRTAIWLRSFFVLPLLAVLVYGFSEKKEVVKNETPQMLFPDETNQIHGVVDTMKDELEKANSLKIHYVENDPIALAGLVMDANSLLPLEDVEIYDTNRHLLGKTDAKGYYSISVDALGEGEIEFSLYLQKSGYQPFTQKEHWGNLSSPIISNFYFGLQKEHSDSEQFSKLVTNSQDLSYESTLNNYNSVKKEILFGKQVEETKRGNEGVFFEIDNTPYLINSYGWIKLNSKQDLVSINGDKVVQAQKLNGLIKRNDVIGMTPVQSKNAQFAVFTEQKKYDEFQKRNSWEEVENILSEQQEASKEQLEEYNKLAKHLNLIIKKQGVVKVKDVVRMKELYELMSEEQRENAEKFPDLSKLPPPPPPANIQQVIPTLTIDQDNKSLKLNGKSTSLETLKQDFLTITSNQKADLKIESKGSISTTLITDLSERLNPYLGKVLFSGTSIIEDREFETTSYKSDQPLNELAVPLLVLNNGTTIPCDKCTVGLTKELIKPLELSTNTKEEITSFQIKFPGKPTELVKGNQLNALALKNLESSQENDHIIIFNIKTSKQTLDSNITIKIIKSVPPPPPPPAPKAEKPVVPTKEG